VRVRTLFVATISLSLAIHALILFALPHSVSRPSSRNETYRVDLIQETVKNAGKEEAETVAVSTVNREKPKPREDSAKLRKAETEKSELAEDIKESEEKKTAGAQIQQEFEPYAESREEVRAVNSGYTSKSRSPMIPGNPAASRRTDYQRILDDLNRLLQEHLQYPETARRKGIEGTLSITFTLDTNGEAREVMVSESSGSRLLDRAAVRAVTGIFPYSDPPDMPLHFTIPVKYRLTEPE
jgi:protein TonB